MADQFVPALHMTLRHEGGVSDHPDDPGGLTARGVTQATYDDWRRQRGEDPRSVREMTDGEIRAIYREGYWAPIRGDDLPPGVGYAVFDAGVMSGPARAARWLQEAAGMPAGQRDGVVGPRTLAAVRAADSADLVQRVCALRLAFCRRLRHWPSFGRGWTRRIDEVEAQALELAGIAAGLRHAPPTAPLPIARARGDVSTQAAARALGADKARSAVTVGGAASAAASAASVAREFGGLEGPVAWGVGAAVALVGLAGAVWLIRRSMSRDAA